MTTEAAFDARYRADPDPWGTDTRAYERAKAQDTMAALPDRPLGPALEMGCGPGTLTESLARRCVHVVAADFSAEAVRLARSRLAGVPNVTLEHCDLRRDWPAGVFDVIVCSEILYYWEPADVREWLARAEASLARGGALVCVHWTGSDPSAPMDGEAVHALLRTETTLSPASSAVRDGYVIDRFDSP